MTDKVRCSREVPGEGRWGVFHMHQCTRKATVERNGKPFCKTHDPVAIKERDDARHREWQEKWDRERAASERKSAAIAFCEGVETETIRALTDNGETLAKWLKEK